MTGFSTISFSNMLAKLGCGDSKLRKISLGEKQDLLDLFASVMNAGFLPTSDSVGFVFARSKAVPVLFDVDLLVKQEKNKAFRKKVMETRRLSFMSWVNALFSGRQRQEALQYLHERVQRPFYKRVVRLHGKECGGVIL